MGGCWVLTCSWHTSKAVKVDSFVCYSLYSLHYMNCFNAHVTFRNDFLEPRLSSVRINCIYLCYFCMPMMNSSSCGCQFSVDVWRIPTISMHTVCSTQTHTKHLHDFYSASSRDSAWCRHRCFTKWQTRWENNTALTAVIRQCEQMFSKYLPFTSASATAWSNPDSFGSCFICEQQNDRKFLRQFKCSTPNNTAIGHTKAAMSSATLKPFYIISAAFG